MIKIFLCFILLVFTAPALVAAGSSESRNIHRKPNLERQNALADHYELERIQPEESSEDFVWRIGLLPVPEKTESFYLDGKISETFRFLRGEALQFLGDFCGIYFKTFKSRCKITALLRPVWYQRMLEELGISDAKSTVKEWRSLHFTASTFDFSKKDIPQNAYPWLRAKFEALAKCGAIHAIDERSHFHILVLPTCTNEARSILAQDLPVKPQKAIVRKAAAQKSLFKKKTR